MKNTRILIIFSSTLIIIVLFAAYLLVRNEDTKKIIGENIEIPLEEPESVSIDQNTYNNGEKGISLSYSNNWKLIDGTENKLPTIALYTGDLVNDEGSHRDTYFGVNDIGYIIIYLDGRPGSGASTNGINESSEIKISNNFISDSVVRLENDDVASMLLKTVNTYSDIFSNLEIYAGIKTNDVSRKCVSYKTEEVIDNDKCYSGVYEGDFGRYMMSGELDVNNKIEFYQILNSINFTPQITEKILPTIQDSSRSDEIVYYDHQPVGYANPAYSNIVGFDKTIGIQLAFSSGIVPSMVNDGSLQEVTTYRFEDGLSGEYNDAFAVFSCFEPGIPKLKSAIPYIDFSQKQKVSNIKVNDINYYYNQYEDFFLLSDIQSVGTFNSDWDIFGCGLMFVGKQLSEVHVQFLRDIQYLESRDDYFEKIFNKFNELYVK